MPSPTPSESLYDAAAAAQAAHDYLALARLGRELIDVCEPAGDERGVAWGQYFVAAAHFQRGDGSSAQRLYREALALFERLGDREGMARSMLGLAAVALDINLDVAEARRLYDVAVPIIRETGDRRRLAIVMGNLGEIHLQEGDRSAALRHAAEAVTLFEEVGDFASAGWQLASMGHYHLLRRDYVSAIESMRKAYPEILRDPLPWTYAWYFDMWFLILAALDRWETAARLLGFVNHFRDAGNAPRLQGILPWFSAPIETLHKRIPGDRLHELLIEGEALDVEAAQALVEGVDSESASADS